MCPMSARSTGKDVNANVPGIGHVPFGRPERTSRAVFGFSPRMSASARTARPKASAIGRSAAEVACSIPFGPLDQHATLQCPGYPRSGSATSTYRRGHRGEDPRTARSNRGPGPGRMPVARHRSAVEGDLLPGGALGQVGGLAEPWGSRQPTAVAGTLVRDSVRTEESCIEKWVSMTAVSISKAREQLFPLVREVNEDHSVIEIVGKDGNAILMSSTDYASWQETLYLLSTPANAAHLAASIAQARSGDIVEVDPDDIRAQLDTESAR